MEANTGVMVRTDPKIRLAFYGTGVQSLAVARVLDAHSVSYELSPFSGAGRAPSHAQFLKDLRHLSLTLDMIDRLKAGCTKGGE